MARKFYCSSEAGQIREMINTRDSSVARANLFNWTHAISQALWLRWLDLWICCWSTSRYRNVSSRDVMCNNISMTSSNELQEAYESMRMVRVCRCADHWENVVLILHVDYDTAYLLANNWVSLTWWFMIWPVLWVGRAGHHAALHTLMNGATDATHNVESGGIFYIEYIERKAADKDECLKRSLGKRLEACQC